MENYNFWKNTQIEDLDGEIWMPVKGYDGTLASNLGRIKTLSRSVRTSGNIKGFRAIGDTVKSQVLGKDGYLRVDALKDNKCKKVTAHRMCCLAFHENIFNKKTVQHKNNIKHCNESWNLCWFTQSEQVSDSFKKNRRVSLVQNYTKSGQDHYRFGKSGTTGFGKKVNQVTMNGEFIKEWDSVYKIKKELAINTYSCLFGRTKSAGGYKWEYSKKN